MIRIFLLLLIGCTSAPAATRHDEAPAAPPPQPVQRTTVISSLTGVVGSGWAPDFNGYAGTSRGCMRSQSFGRFAVDVGRNEGDRLLSLVVEVEGAGFGDLDITALNRKPDGSLALGTLGSLTIQDPAIGSLDYPVDLVDTVVADGVSHWIEFGATASGLCVGAVRLTYEQAL